MKPLTAEELGLVAGPDALVLLETAFRGCLIYIPCGKRRGKAYRDLAKVIGEERTAQLVSRLGGRWTYFKKRHLDHIREKHARIAATYHGQTISHFANQNGISVPTAYSILKKAGKITRKKEVQENVG